MEVTVKLNIDLYDKIVKIECQGMTFECTAEIDQKTVLGILSSPMKAISAMVIKEMNANEA